MKVIIRCAGCGKPIAKGEKNVFSVTNYRMVCDCGHEMVVNGYSNIVEIKEEPVKDSTRSMGGVRWR